MEKFLWNEGRPKISLVTLQKAKEEGGLNLVNFYVKDQALKASWVQILNSDPFLMEFVYRALCPTLRGKNWWCELKEKDIKVMFKESFWRGVLVAWNNLKRMSNTLYTSERDEILNQFLWYNSNIRIRDKPLLIVNAFNNNLLHVSQLFTEQGTIVSVEELCQKFTLTVLECNGLIAAIPKRWKSIIKIEKKPFNKVQPDFWSIFQIKMKCVSYAYKMLNSNMNVLYLLYE